MDTTLVTGATGLVGYHIVQSLLQRGRRIRVLVRSIDKGRALLPEACELVQGDITDQVAVQRAMEGCSVVYHAAGIPEQWLPDPARFHNVNVGGTVALMEAMRDVGVRRVVLASSGAVYGDLAEQAVQRFAGPGRTRDHDVRTQIVATLEKGVLPCRAQGRANQQPRSREISAQHHRTVIPLRKAEPGGVQRIADVGGITRRRNVRQKAALNQ